jgi:hypothetical protein
MSERGSAARDEDPNLRDVVLDDLRRTRFRSEFGRELYDLYRFYLSDERRERLTSMGRVHRALSLLGWLLKSLLMKLSPGRRLMLVVAFLCAILGWKSLQVGGVVLSVDFRPVGFVILLVVLMLELRDKLLARDEIAVARQVQLALLPHRHPEVPGWRVWSHSLPANDVGGDLVDYVALDGFRHAVVLADVSGKGLGAALLSAKLQATLRALLPIAASLDDLGAQVNRILHRDGLDNRYATLFVAELEHHSAQVRYLNAGHNPPMLLRAGGLDTLGASAQPVGMLESVSYQESALELAPGDAIIAYSDGLTEAINAAGEEFGAERLRAVLAELRGRPPAVVGARILAAVETFQGEVRPADDLSLAIIVRD